MAAPVQILTANRLRDGDVVYWRAGNWVENLGDADLFADKVTAQEALSAAETAVRDRIIVSPYLFPVRNEDGTLRPLEQREIIRAAGPSVRLDLGKQGQRHVPL
jgi:hypothetical protein